MTSRNTDRDQEIVRRHAAGERTMDMAAEYGLHLTRINQILRQEKARGAAPPKSEPTPAMSGGLEPDQAMQSKVRPRIRKAASGLWECSDGIVSRAAHTAQGAYQRWLTAALLEAERSLKPAAWPQPAEVDLARKRPATVKGSPTTGVVVPSSRSIPAPEPEAYTGPVTVVPGTRPMRPLALPQGLRLAGMRAAEVQPALVSIASNKHSVWVD